MNKTMTAVVVVLLTVTALFAMADYGESDGETYEQGSTIRHLTTDYTVITDCGTRTYTDSSLPDKYIFVANCNVKEGAFRNCTSLEEIIFDRSVESIGDYAFAGCTNLDYMSGYYLKSIGAHAFEGTDIYYLGIGENMRSLGDYAFKDCKHLSRVPIYKTSLTSIGNGVFYGCTSLKLIDLRGITSTASNAFYGANIERQVLDVGQTYCLPNIPKIWIEDGSMYRNVPWGNATYYYIDSEAYSRITLYDMQGNEVENNIAYESYATINRFTIEADKDYISGTYYRTIHYPDGLGLEDARAKSGLDFPLPTVTLGDLTATKWVVSGITGEVDMIGAWYMQKMGDTVEPTPAFDTVDAVLDHSDVPSVVDTSGLATTLTYTFGDTYPQLPDVEGYTHTGWVVGDETLGPTDRITDFTVHTARSLWTPTVLHTLTYTQKDGTVISTEQQGNGRDITVSDTVATEDDHEVFIGWTAEGIGETIVSGQTLTMTGDVTLSPVFGERAVRHVTFLSDSMLLDTVDVYDGRTMTISIDDPVRDWFDFLYWKSGDTMVTKGMSLTVDSDMEFNAIWKTVRKVTVTYHTTDGPIGRDHRADSPVTIFMEPGESEGMRFEGWGTTPKTDEVAYTNGSVATLSSDITLYAIWTEVPAEPDAPVDVPPVDPPSSEPTLPETPIEQPRPTLPEEPSVPDEPVIEPDEPEEPYEPETPDTPDEPMVPTVPAIPDTDVPGGTEAPSVQPDITVPSVTPERTDDGRTEPVDVRALAFGVATAIGAVMAAFIAMQMRRN